MTPSDEEVLNDIDEDLICFLRVVKHQTEQFLESFDLNVVSRSEFNRLASLDPASLT